MKKHPAWYLVAGCQESKKEVVDEIRLARVVFGLSEGHLVSTSVIAVPVAIAHRTINAMFHPCEHSSLLSMSAIELCNELACSFRVLSASSSLGSKSSRLLCKFLESVES